MRSQKVSGPVGSGTEETEGMEVWFVRMFAGLELKRMLSREASCTFAEHSWGFLPPISSLSYIRSQPESLTHFVNITFTLNL